MVVFDQRNIALNVTPTDKLAAIRMCGDILLEAGYIRSAYIDDMLEREKIISTYIGNNVAIPHGLSSSNDNIMFSGLSLLQVPNGVEFGTPAGSSLAYVVIGIAGKNGEHMDMLGKLAEVLMDLDKVQQLRRAKTEKEIMALFEEVSL